MTWNVYKGCRYACTYCIPSFQAINKRINSCKLCQAYIPHFHEERLNKIPKAKVIFVAANGDLSFAPRDTVLDILIAMEMHVCEYPETVFYLQSKNPAFFKDFLNDIPEETILLTTLETNYDHDYELISAAPPPQERWRAFKDLDWSRKIITVEPIIEFDMKEFLNMIAQIDPMKVYVGYNTRPKACDLPEPSLEKTKKLIQLIREMEIEVEEKNMER